MNSILVSLVSRILSHKKTGRRFLPEHQTRISSSIKIESVYDIGTKILQSLDSEKKYRERGY